MRGIIDDAGSLTTASTAAPASCSAVPTTLLICPLTWLGSEDIVKRFKDLCLWELGCESVCVS